MPKGSVKPCAVVKFTQQGRSPLCFLGKNFCFLNRDGRNLCIHENNLDKNFPRIKEIVASDLIINAVTYSETGNAVYTGGYDSTVKKWDLNTFECLSSNNLGCCINALSFSTKNYLYVARSDGFITKLDC